jgi:hypothetical protein
MGFTVIYSCLNLCQYKTKNDLLYGKHKLCKYLRQPSSVRHASVGLPRVKQRKLTYSHICT